MNQKKWTYIVLVVYMCALPYRCSAFCWRCNFHLHNGIFFFSNIREPQKLLRLDYFCDSNVFFLFLTNMMGVVLFFNKNFKNNQWKKILWWLSCRPKRKGFTDNGTRYYDRLLQPKHWKFWTIFFFILKFWIEFLCIV